jgi:hypothetical protein
MKEPLYITNQLILKFSHKFFLLLSIQPLNVFDPSPIGIGLMY